MVASRDVGYPAWVRLSRENGDWGAFFELTDIKEVAPQSSLYEIDGLEKQ
jgi:hypothetical protein